jgi:lactoylglutathione lyase
MANFRGIDHINLNVNNLQESISWYQKVFGFEVKEQGVSSNGNDYAIIGKSGRGFLCLYPVSEGFPAPRLNHLGFAIDNFDDFVEFVKAEDIDVAIYSFGMVVEYPNSKSVYIKDPNGIEIEVSSRFGGGL